MFFRKFFFLFVILVFMGSLFSMTGRSQSQYYDGYTQGFVAGQQSVQGTDGTTAVAPPPPAPAAHHYSGFGFFGFLLKGFGFLFSFMLLIGFMGMLFGRKHWHHHGRKWHKEWPKHSHKTPWYDDDLSDEPIMKA